MDRPLNRLAPACRISLGLALLTVSIVLIGDFLGITPDLMQAKIDARKNMSESMAIQFATFASKKDLHKFRKSVSLIVERNDEILSAGLRNTAGLLVFEIAGHDLRWGEYRSTRSTLTHVVVPVFQGRQLWGSIEVLFKPIVDDTLLGIFNRPVFQLLLFVAVFGFLGYFLFILRILRQLDPSAVIPDRVNSAFNTLAEGVLILDDREYIVLANTAFSETVQREAEALIGLKASELNWLAPQGRPAAYQFPWNRTLKHGESVIGEQLAIPVLSGDPRRLMVNTAPIGEANSKQRGVLVTFDDVTELEQKNSQLLSTVSRLEQSQEKVERQNKKLHFLATRDPLTGCLNRRAYTERFKALFAAARSRGDELTCIMADIDHFKSVNDTYGHATGDEVIKLLAQILTAVVPKPGVVGRYGGEEFCVLLPGLAMAEAVTIAERIRLRLKDDSTKNFSAGPRVTASLGVSSIKDGAASPDELNNQADQSLYIAKESGRNRVVSWDKTQSQKNEPKTEAGVGDSALAEDTPTAHPEILTDLADGSAADAAQNASGNVVERLQVRVRQLEQVASKYSLELQYKNSYDNLTGLPNQLLFYDRLKQAIERAQRRKYTVAVLTLDIDTFKRVNNTFGRGAGNTLLKELSDRLLSILRTTDGITLFGPKNKDFTLSHLGGDEFAILLTDLHEMQIVTWIVKRIFENLAEPFEIEGQKLVVSCSIGISLYPADGKTPETLLNQSAVARQCAKQMPGKNNYQLFDSQIHQLSLSQMRIESELRRAIKHDEFILYYQPKLDIQSSTVKGVEALIRWNHPERGLLTPFEFIEVAEQSGLILDIGNWVLKQACLQTKQWLSQGIPDISVAVNLSTLQLRQTDFSHQVLQILEDTDLPPRHIEIEITETVIMDNLDTAIDTLNQLHAHGIWIAIDDFGTGYSSLNYLKHLPLDSLKIDRSFLRDILTDAYDKSIVKTIIAMAHSMNLKVTAEGVETEEQLALLRQFRCDEIQGYLFTKPLSALETTQLLRTKSNLAVQRAS
jgi:diguanylate cyclase (GGDEF)-like protein/PAS domain S-box-containing protein